MKKILFTLFVSSILFGCQSKEEKVAKLIKEDMFKTLYDFQSYEPIETKIDSAFTSIYRDSLILYYAYLSVEYLEKSKTSLKKAKDAGETMKIWYNSYSSYGYSKYKEARDEFSENIEKSKNYASKVDTLCKLIKDRYSEFTSVFCGWQSIHKFRCKSKGGNFSLGNYMYVFDKDIKEIIYSEDLDDEKTQKIKELIEGVVIE
jgi:hypothetical protein